MIVVDNGDGGPEIEAAAGRAGVEVIRPGGTSASRRGATSALHARRGEVLLFLNPDTVVTPGAVAELAASVGKDDVGAAMGRLLLSPIRRRLTRAAPRSTSRASAGPRAMESRPSTAASRGDHLCERFALAMRRELFEWLGGFTEELFLYHEDLELGWRARMAGKRIVLNPSADVLHDYEHERNPAKYYFMERNRLVFVALRVLGPAAPAFDAGALRG